MYLLTPFIVQNFQNILRVDPELEDAPFSNPKWPICPNKNFFRKTGNIISMYLLTPFIMKN